MDHNGSNGREKNSAFLLISTFFGGGGGYFLGFYRVGVMHDLNQFGVWPTAPDSRNSEELTIDAILEQFACDSYPNTIQPSIQITSHETHIIRYWYYHVLNPLFHHHPSLKRARQKSQITIKFTHNNYIIDLIWHVKKAYFYLLILIYTAWKQENNVHSHN